jgi:hypothetical protein
MEYPNTDPREPIVISPDPTSDALQKPVRVGQRKIMGSTAMLHSTFQKKNRALGFLWDM